MKLFSWRVFVLITALNLALSMALLTALEFKYQRDLVQARAQSAAYLQSFIDAQLRSQADTLGAALRERRPWSNLNLQRPLSSPIAASFDFSREDQDKGERAKMGRIEAVKAQYRVLPDGSRELRFVPQTDLRGK